MRELITPTVELRDAWREASADWAGEEQHGSGLSEAFDVGADEGFAAWVAYLRQQQDETVPVAEGRVHATYWWIVEDGVVLGAISLRHRLNDDLREVGGHIGYGVRPSARGRGVAAWALAQVLDRARERGLERVMISCQESNIGSARTIERNGGVLQDVADTWLGRTRRYWVDLGGDG
ncbi:MAG: GNAT family N-acetyltransferase [Hamadaea sp.]|nr:GNAT family N-acetyltransferase [Hamadaea sp.]